MVNPTLVEAHGSPGVAPATDAQLVGTAKLDRGGVAWSIFDIGFISYSNLMITFIFMPYLAATMVGDPVKGQELLARFGQYGGWIVMATAPFLGASIDKLGPRKPLLAATVICLVPLIVSLWFAKPDGSGLPILVAMTIVMTVSVLFAWSDVLHNSMLVPSVGVKRAHLASGLSVAVGNGAGFLALIFTAWAFVAPGRAHLSWVPAAPIFGLNPAIHEPERVVAILAAGLLALGAIPLFLFTADAPKTGVPMRTALRQGVEELWGILKTVSRHKDAVVFLGARMLFVDGMSGMLAFFGVFAAGVLKWGPLELLATGVLSGVAAIFGGFVGPWLDHNVGPKNALRIEVSVVMLCLAVVLGTAPDRLFFFWTYHAAAHAPLWSGPVFRTLPDLIVLLIGCLSAVFVSGQFASSRTALVRLAPPAQTGAFFGAYALSGAATGWLAPSLVNLGTRLTHTQQGGIVGVLGLLLAGLIGLFFVQGGGRETTASTAAV